MKSAVLFLVLAVLWSSSHALSNSLLFKPGEANICPDGKGQCTPETTCCELKNGGYGCCPIPEAVCCSDHKHCCPKDYSCDVKTQACVHKDGEVVGWSEKIPATPAPQLLMTSAVSSDKVGVVICPDEKSQCMDGYTCCQLASSEWACCPLPQAVCCPDHAHCCPNSYKCDTARARCVKNSSEPALIAAPVLLPWLNYVPVQSNIVKCDSKVACQDGQTCCKVKGTWACCPTPKAVCCSDTVHCCPAGYKCISPAGVCVKESSSIMWSSIASAEQNSVVGDVKCDDKVSCPTSETCCKLASGDWGCCPLPQAVCCSDKVHCCPNGYTCNIAMGTCDHGLVQIPWYTKVPGISTTVEVNEDNEKSPKTYSCTGQAWCKHGSTCCESRDGSLRGCCKEENAVCCGDGVHCCPSGSTCDSVAGMCRSVDSSLAFTWQMTRRVDGYGGLRPIEAVAGVQCPDKSTCSDDNTCCQLPSKQYACCPYAQGVCCADQLHCCPNGMQCDVPHSKCIQDGFSLPWNLYSRNRAKSPTVMERDHKLTLSKDTCPDLISVCQENSTCCLMQSGAYGCCSHKNAVCCSDKLNCCPYGTTCDVEKQACTPSVESHNNNNDNKENVAGVEEDAFNDIPFPIGNPFRRFN